jgi:hypothetical protein
MAIIEPMLYANVKIQISITGIGQGGLYQSGTQNKSENRKGCQLERECKYKCSILVPDILNNRLKNDPSIF